MLITRGQHWTDTPRDAGIVRRVLRNWSNYQEPGRDWLSVSPAISLSASKPDNWGSDKYDFELEVKANALQAYFADTTDISNSAMVGCRIASDPGTWINFKALDVNNDWGTEIPSVNSYRWNRLWDNTDLEYVSQPGKLKLDIECSKPGHPLIFRYTVKLPDGYRLGEFKNNSVAILDSQGVKKLQLVAPYGLDSSRLNLDTPTGQKFIPVKMQRGNDVGGLTVIELVLDQADLDGAVYPILIDPNVKIIGTTDFDDTFLASNLGTRSFGAWTSIQIGRVNGVPLRRELIRGATSGMPAGTITGASLFFHRIANGSHSTQPGVLGIYRVVPANDWREGTASNADIPDDPDWNQCKSGSQDWAGHPTLGCGVSGVDFIADGSPPGGAYIAYPAGPDVWVDFSIFSPGWIEGWRDSTYANEGMVLFGTEGTSATLFQAHSSETGTSASRPYLSIDYVAAGGGNAQRFFFMGSS